MNAWRIPAHLAVEPRDERRSLIRQGAKKNVLWATAIALLLFVATPMMAQLLSNQSSGTIRVDVVTSKGGHAPAGLSVQLMGGLSNRGVAMNTTSSSGTVEFEGLGPGNYHVRVSGPGIKTTESDTVVVQGTTVFESVTVVVQEAEQGSAGGPSVAAVDLNVPKEAAKEYDRGNQEMAHKNWNKAIDHFNKAITIYPQYSSAYNNLAACYEQLGKKDQQREALQKAISANDHCVPAMVNLAYLAVDDHNLPEAVILLNKAAAADPNYVEALVLQARVDFMQGRYDDAISEARKVHSLPHQRFAIVHYTAAGALERENRLPEAIAELQLYLKEEPSGPRSDSIRKTIAAFQKQSP
jgi:Flp pilus assembly protein TadD